MRTREELQGAVTKLEIAMQGADWQAIKREIELIKEDIIQAHYMDKPEDAVRTLGVLQGIGVCLNLKDIINATANLGTKPTIVKP